MACNSITAGGDFTITPDFSVLAPAHVVFQAGSSIELRNGVFVQEDASLSLVLAVSDLCDS